MRWVFERFVHLRSDCLLFRTEFMQGLECDEESSTVHVGAKSRAFAGILTRLVEGNGSRAHGWPTAGQGLSLATDG